MKKGYTLIEVAIAISLLILIVTFTSINFVSRNKYANFEKDFWQFVNLIRELYQLSEDASDFSLYKIKIDGEDIFLIENVDVKKELNIKENIYFDGKQYQRALLKYESDGRLKLICDGKETSVKNIDFTDGEHVKKIIVDEISSGNLIIQ